MEHDDVHTVKEIILVPGTLTPLPTSSTKVTVIRTIKILEGKERLLFRRV